MAPERDVITVKYHESNQHCEEPTLTSKRIVKCQSGELKDN